MKYALFALAALLSLTGITALPPATVGLTCVRENQEGQPWRVDLIFQGSEATARVSRPGTGSRPYEVDLRVYPQGNVDLYAGKGFEAKIDLAKAWQSHHPLTPVIKKKSVSVHGAFLSDEELFEENVPLACVKLRDPRDASAPSSILPASY